MVNGLADCVFCRIVAGQIPTEFLYQDDQVVAFRDIHPAAPTHILVVPRRHIPDLRSGDAARPELWASIIQTIQRLAAEEGISAEGFRTVINTGVKAGQSVFHLHVHLLGGKEYGAL